ncbi:acetyltransferase [Ningiella sp. W23]|uniref:acetyltransferase n=1 Tax=Ningiella sp. W23 TaxID=3023715 RepID=UPI003757154B
MKRRLCIVGAGGHGKVAAVTAIEMGGYSDIVFFDKLADAKSCPEQQCVEQWPIVGTPKDCMKYSSKHTDFFIAIGSNEARRDMFKLLQSYSLPIASLVHPSAYVSDRTELGHGCLICANASVIGFSSIGHGGIINTNASVDHDCRLGDFVHIAPGANVAGGVDIGNECLIGIGSSVLPNLSLGASATIGAGATVISNVAPNATVVGTPAKTLR